MGLRRTRSTVRWSPWLVFQEIPVAKSFVVLQLNQSQLKLLVTASCAFFQKVDCPPARNGRRSNILKVAMTFPTKKMGKKRPASEPLPQSKAPEPDSEGEENFIVKRALNIKENKEMVRLFYTSLTLCGV